jgi:hypothetical protein
MAPDSTAAARAAYHRRVPALDPTWLFLSLIPSGIGFVLFTYGRKQERLPHIGAGIAYMVYPYFTPSLTAMLLVGVGLGVGLWLAVRAGW